jgi:hypothetical protein
MIDFLVILLSTDWFLPYWEDIGINVTETKKIDIQQGCREIVDEMLNGAETVFMGDCSEDRKRKTASSFLALLRRLDAESEVSATCIEWVSLSHDALTTVVLCVLQNDGLRFAATTDSVPNLEDPIRAEVMKTWEVYAVSASIFRDICLSSTTEWDLRTKQILENPRALANQLWRFLLNRRMRAFWADIRERLTPQQRRDLAAWYCAAISSKTGRPVLIPAYMKDPGNWTGQENGKPGRPASPA